MSCYECGGPINHTALSASLAFCGSPCRLRYRRAFAALVFRATIDLGAPKVAKLCDVDPATVERWARGSSWPILSAMGPHRERLRRALLGWPPCT